jgi:catechol 2,3-dioxygenase-like lactoylglutathione lyase family enzyme
VKITRILHVSVNVLDRLDESRAFYRDLLELPSTPRPEIPGVDGHWFRIGGTELHLVDAPIPDVGIAPTAQHWCVGVADLAGAVDELEQRGIPYVQGAQGDVRQIWFCDPAGNVIELQEDRP